MYRDIAVTLDMTVEQVQSLPIDDFLVAKKESKIMKQVKTNLISDGVFSGIARVLNETNKKGGDK